jgi:hypothetical protein
MYEKTDEYFKWGKKQTEERIKYFNAIYKKYGFNQVPAKVTYNAFEEIVNPERLGFIPIKIGFYACPINDDIVHLLKLLALKGTQYTFQWGASLSYVPHEWKKGLHWSKSLKSSKFDLFQFGHESSFWGADWKENINHVVQTMNGEKFLKETTKTAWDELHDTITDWFSSTQNLIDILRKADEQVKKNLDYHYPNPLLVYAFTQKRLGKVEEANEALTKFLASRKEGVEVQNNLKIAIEKI